MKQTEPLSIEQISLFTEQILSLLPQNGFSEDQLNEVIMYVINNSLSYENDNFLSACQQVKRYFQH